MAEFAKCHICRALMVDDPDDRREHLGKHADSAKKIEAQRVKVNGLLDQIAVLRDQVKGYGQQLEQHPISIAPESISINEMPEDEIDAFEDDLPTSKYADDDVAATIANPTAANPTAGEPTAGEPTEDAADLLPVNDAISNLYTPRT